MLEEGYGAGRTGFARPGGVTQAIRQRLQQPEDETAVGRFGGPGSVMIVKTSQYRYRPLPDNWIRIDGQGFHHRQYVAGSRVTRQAKRQSIVQQTQLIRG